MKTVWRNTSTNLVPKSGMDYSSHVRRGASGWTWSLMIQAELVTRGTARTKLAAVEAVRNAKSARTGKRIRQPAHTGDKA